VMVPPIPAYLARRWWESVFSSPKEPEEGRWKPLRPPYGILVLPLHAEDPSQCRGQNATWRRVLTMVDRR
jgi:hypothetical protein